MVAEPFPEGGGSIVNFSSMAARRAMTRVIGYGAGKAASSDVTRSGSRSSSVARAAEHLRLRVNAVAPGFFIGAQNRSLLLDADGISTPRGETVLAHTPAAASASPERSRRGRLALECASASFVTGVVLPVDGGFDAFSGV